MIQMFNGYKALPIEQFLVGNQSLNYLSNNSINVAARLGRCDGFASSRCGFHAV